MLTPCKIQLMGKSTCLWIILGLCLIISHQFAEDYTGSLISVTILSILWILWIRQPQTRLSANQNLMLAICLRVFLFLSSGVFEDDWHRYRSEGLLQNMGFNVYTLAPSDALTNHLNDIRHSPQKAEIVYHLARTGYPQFPAIYPRELIAIFGFVPSLIFLFLLTDLIVLILLKKYYPKVFYLWCLHPLILMEGFVNKHYDVLLVLPLILAHRLMQQKKTGFQILSGLLWGLVFSLKGMALFLWFLLPSKQKLYSLIFLLGFLTQAYFTNSSRFTPDSSLVIFTQWWEVNSPLAYTLRTFLTEFFHPEQTMLLGRFFMGSLFVLLIFWKQKSLKSSSLMSIMLIANPINNPWYLILPLAYGLLENDWDVNWIPLACLGYYACWIGDSPGLALFIYLPLNLGLPWWYLWREQNNGPPHDSPDLLLSRLSLPVAPRC